MPTTGHVLLDVALHNFLNPIEPIYISFMNLKAHLGLKTTQKFIALL